MYVEFLERYKSLWEAMERLEKDKTLPKSQVLPQFSDSLGELKFFLDNYQSKNWLNRLAAYRGVMDRIADFNTNIDNMLNVDFMAKSLMRQGTLAVEQQKILTLLESMANDK